MKILVTSGPTREPIDPVRFISNRSSGKMGHAVAKAAIDRGHEVVLVSGPVHLNAPRGARVVSVETALDLLQAVEDNVRWCDALVMAAAVADWRPKVVSRRKLKKRAMSGVMELERNPDILMSMRKHKKGRIYVGFAAETENLLGEGRRKLEEKGVDLIVANDVSRPDSGFDADTNKAWLLSADGGTEELPLMSKTALAARIIEWMESRPSRRRRSTQ